MKKTRVYSDWVSNEIPSAECRLWMVKIRIIFEERCSRSAEIRKGFIVGTMDGCGGGGSGGEGGNGGGG